MRNNEFNIGTAAITVIIIIICAVAIGRPITKAYARKEITATVKDKSTKRGGDKDKYLIYCKDNAGRTQVFEITDSFLAMRFNSSDLYAEIEVGKKYIFDVGGNRVPFMSWYPNIYSAREIS